MTTKTSAFQLHPAEFRTLQQAAAKNGVALTEGDVTSYAEFCEAVFLGLDPETAAELEKFLETGAYPGMDERVAARDREACDVDATAETAPESPSDTFTARRAALRTT